MHTLKKAVSLASERVGAVYGIMANTGPVIAMATASALVDSLDERGLGRIYWSRTSIRGWVVALVSSLVVDTYMPYNYGRHPCTQRYELREDARVSWQLVTLVGSEKPSDQVRTGRPSQYNSCLTSQVPHELGIRRLRGAFDTNWSRHSEARHRCIPRSVMGLHMS